jgi:hypothetical protein
MTTEHQRTPEEIIAAAPPCAVGGLTLGFSCEAGRTGSMRALLKRNSTGIVGTQESALVILRLVRARGYEYLLTSASFSAIALAKAHELARALAGRPVGRLNCEMLGELIGLAPALPPESGRTTELLVELVALRGPMEQYHRKLAHAT